MTSRGWWTLVFLLLMLLVGILLNISALAVAGLALLLWFAWEWLFFVLRQRTLLRRLRVERRVGDDRGPVSTLWQSRDYTVEAVLRLEGEGRFPYLAVADPVPFALRHLDGLTHGDGELTPDQPITLSYRVHAPLPGVARFEGLRIEFSDLQGFFSHVGFVRMPLELRILPGVLIHRGGGPTVKRHNELLPPGIHRLRQPGSGSELLDLRDYLPGDPPRTIAWKVSARRDRLVTKEFESEVPIRCTLFLDASSSVRVPSPVWSRDDDEPLYFKPLDRLVELAAGVVRLNAALRDLTGLCVFDEEGYQIVRPERSPHHTNRLLQLLGDTAARGPVAGRADADALLPVAYALAQEVYPDLLRPENNAMPWWLTWVIGFPRYTRHQRGWINALHRSKHSMLLWATLLIPFGVLTANIAAAVFDGVPAWARSFLGGMFFFGSPILAFLGWLAFFFSILVSGKQRKLARWRKRLAALFCVRAMTGQGRPLPVPGGLELLLEDDDLFSEQLQRFLVEHQVPCAVPLYDEQGRYLFALPRKVELLGQALLHAVSRGHDNELFVLVADLLELDAAIEPLLQAVRVALGRHHQVLLVCPWPEGIPLPTTAQPAPPPAEPTLKSVLKQLTLERIDQAHRRIARAFARLGVSVVCASSKESLPLILDRIERLRSARISAGGARR